ncbi:DUF1513 domain-containing protein [Azospirillum griseum]|nr:DUF1513 domain-containing protein [Azospirillum griseum]
MRDPVMRNAVVTTHATTGRRTALRLLGALGVVAWAGPLVAASDAATGTAGRTLFLNAYATAGATPAFGVAAFDVDGAVRFTTATPGRAHGVVPRPALDGTSQSEAVVFARRPGRWFLPLSLRDGTPAAPVTAPEDRRFTGHGAFTADGRLLYVAEDDVPNETGAIGVYDATDGYRRLGALPTHGLGPHELLALDGGAVLAVANGGVITHPDTGRAKLNLDAMDSSLTYVEAASGRLLDQVRLPEEHANLGIRHIAALADGGVAFGVQDERPIGLLQPLVGAHRPGGGAVRLFDAPEDVWTRLDGYIGSVASDGRLVAASSPKGGLVGLWDPMTGAWIKAIPLPDGCGLAPCDDGFALTSGLGVMERITATTDAPVSERRSPAFRWDNHLTRWWG